MNEMQVFQNEEFGKVRTVTIDDAPFFVGKDVAEILGYTNTQKAIRDHVDDDDKLTERIVLSGQNREAVIINESGLYALCLSSKLPSAKKFKHWVTAEVLPTIRKTGSYSIPQVTPNPHYRTRMIATAVKDIGKTAEAMEKVFAVKHGMALAASMDMVGEAYGIDTTPMRRLVPAEENPGTLNATQLAEKLGFQYKNGKPNPAECNKFLESHGFQEKQGKTWRLTKNGKGYAEEKPFSRNGHSGYNIAWQMNVVDILRRMMAAEQPA